jgi:hypothetical protein
MCAVLRKCRYLCVFWFCFCCIGCSDETLGDDVTFPFAPWHMWGNTVRIVVPGPSVGAFSEVQATQLLRINYARPETWSFFFSGRIVGGDVQAVEVNAFAFFEIILGVGRSNFKTDITPQTDPFESFRWNVLAGNVPAQQGAKWTTSVETPVLNDTSNERRIVEWVPGQDIQVIARARTVNAEPGNTYEFELTGFFAPRSHVRPEWFSDSEDESRFRGKETGGT